MSETTSPGSEMEFTKNQLDTLIRNDGNTTLDEHKENMHECIVLLTDALVHQSHDINKLMGKSVLGQAGSEIKSGVYNAGLAGVRGIGTGLKMTAQGLKKGAELGAYGVIKGAELGAKGAELGARGVGATALGASGVALGAAKGAALAAAGIGAKTTDYVGNLVTGKDLGLADKYHLKDTGLHNILTSAADQGYAGATSMKPSKESWYDATTRRAKGIFGIKGGHTRRSHRSFRSRRTSRVRHNGRSRRVRRKN